MTSFLRSIMKPALALVLVTGLSACSIFGGDDDGLGDTLEPKTTALGVNGYLWQATLDTLSFMPIEGADPSAGVIITGWHSEAQSRDERVRVTVQFLTQALRSDGIKVNVVRQSRDGGQWVAAPVKASTALQIEEAILTQARILKVGKVK